ncbi:small lysine-rich protein 1 [Sardina pilchardus]|uniref:small lysine-rich protein 1 n=1 Tax=Sardina pilchardus TaxID=27697 RepID=UPI002E121458
MPAEGRKQRSHSARPSRRRRSRRRASSAKSPRAEVDILSPAAMTNAYYISHNAMDCLEFRGFGWPEAHRKEGKRARKPRSRK